MTLNRQKTDVIAAADGAILVGFVVGEEHGTVHRLDFDKWLLVNLKNSPIIVTSWGLSWEQKSGHYVKDEAHLPLWEKIMPGDTWTALSLDWHEYFVGEAGVAGTTLAKYEEQEVVVHIELLTAEGSQSITTPTFFGKNKNAPYTVLRKLGK